MPNRTLNEEELHQANELLTEIKDRLKTLSGDDSELLFAFRRKIAKQLSYEERSGPMVRRKLKIQKRIEQNNLCAVCQISLPDKYAILDRYVASQGYIAENTRLICELCDRKIQAERGYA